MRPTCLYRSGARFFPDFIGVTLSGAIVTCISAENVDMTIAPKVSDCKIDPILTPSEARFLLFPI